MATKKAVSQHSVRQSTFSVSAKASDILRTFSPTPITDTHDQDWSTGVIYFKGYAGTDIGQANAPLQTQEIIGLYPAWLLTCQNLAMGNEVTLYRRLPTGRGYAQQKSRDDFFDQLHRHYDGLQASLDTTKHPQTNPSNNFSGGLAGFIGYDPDAQQQGVSHTLALAHDREKIAEATSLLAAMGHYDIFLKKEDRDWVLYGPDDAALLPIYDQIKQRLAQQQTQAASNHFQVIQPFRKVWQMQDYQTAFTRVQHYLQSGDCYQVNLTQPFIASVSGSLLDTLDALMALTQAPYSGYMRVGNHELLSCSPELFLAFSGTQAHDMTHPAHNQVVTRPIKGTFPRSSDPVLDLAYKERLTHSEKDHSENLMIVDLLRNDLSKHAETGSVQVPVLFAVESFAQVHHLVSEIRATLSADASPLDVLLAALPGGSITGAPKKRAMEIIAELEAAPRGAYCGSLGYLNHDGSGQFNILIRTLQQHGSHLVAWAGGGITVASELEAEYQECFDKIKAILECVNQLGAQ